MQKKRAAHPLFSSWRFCLGAGADLAFGWLFMPAAAKNADLNQLRADYKTDLTLMVAEIYAQDRQMPRWTAWRGLSRKTPTPCW